MKGLLALKFTVSMKKNHEFRRLYAKGKNHAMSTLVVYYRRVNRDYNQLGITVSTKVGNAVTRNLVRRRIREIYRLHEEELLCGLDIVIVARVRAANATYSHLEHDFAGACRQLNILRVRDGEGE